MTTRSNRPDGYFRTPEQQVLLVKDTATILLALIRQHQKHRSPGLSQAIQNVDDLIDSQHLTATLLHTKLRHALGEMLMHLEHGPLQMIRKGLDNWIIRDEHAVGFEDIDKVKDEYMREALTHEKKAIAESYDRATGLFAEEERQRHANVTEPAEWVKAVLPLAELAGRLMRLEEVHVDETEPDPAKRKRKRDQLKQVFVEKCSLMSLAPESHILGRAFNRISMRKARLYNLNSNRA